MSKEIAAAGIILLKQSSVDLPFEVLLLKRNSTLKVHGGNWVFPGGKVDTEDYRVINHLPSNIDLHHPPALSASDFLTLASQTAIRETFEEAGILLAAHDLQFYSRWLSPKVIDKRFNTCFFMAKSPSTTVKVDGSEIVDHQWLTPKECLALHKNGDIKVPPATYVSLVELNRFEQAQTAIDTLCQNPVYYRPKLISIKGGLCSLYEDDAGYPNEDYLAEGKHHRLEMTSGNYNYINHFHRIDAVQKTQR